MKVHYYLVYDLFPGYQKNQEPYRQGNQTSPLEFNENIPAFFRYQIKKSAQYLALKKCSIPMQKINRGFSPDVVAPKKAIPFHGNTSFQASTKY